MDIWGCFTSTTVWVIFMCLCASSETRLRQFYDKKTSKRVSINFETTSKGCI